MIKNWCFLCLCLTATVASAEVKTETVIYRDGETVLEGVMVWDTTKVNGNGAKKLPGVLIVHQWLGLTDYEKGRAAQLAEMGYVAFALDIYGQKTRPANVQEAGGFAGKYKKDRNLYRKRLQLGLEQLQKSPWVDGSKMAAIGYCFGGTMCLELVRAGTDLAAIVGFHSGLSTSSKVAPGAITAKVLVCIGAGKVDRKVQPMHLEGTPRNNQSTPKQHGCSPFPRLLHIILAAAVRCLHLCVQLVCALSARCVVM